MTGLSYESWACARPNCAPVPCACTLALGRVRPERQSRDVSSSRPTVSSRNARISASATKVEQRGRSRPSDPAEHPLPTSRRGSAATRGTRCVRSGCSPTHEGFAAVLGRNSSACTCSGPAAPTRCRGCRSPARTVAARRLERVARRDARRRQQERCDRFTASSDHVEHLADEEEGTAATRPTRSRARCRPARR